MLRMLVLPAPDGPNSAVSPGPAVKRAARIRSPRRRETSISIATALPFAMRAADEPFGKNQRAEREHNRQQRSEHTSELQSLMRISYDGFCLKKKKKKQINNQEHSQRNK